MNHHLRPFTVADTAAVSDVCREALTLDGYADHLPEALLRQPRIGIVATDGSLITGLCFVSHGADDESKAGFIDLIAVLPERQCHGIGRDLLRAGESALEDLGCRTVRVTGNPPFYAWPGVDKRYATAAALFDAAGYERATTAVNLGVDLTSAPIDTAEDEFRLTSLGFSFHRAETADAEPIASELASVWSQSVISEIRAALRSDHGGLHIAMRGGACTGFCAYGVTRPHDVGPLGTAASVRRLGVGATLIRRCLQDQRNRGLLRAEVQWAGPRRWLAQTLDASISRQFIVYRKELDTRSA